MEDYFGMEWDDIRDGFPVTKDDTFREDYVAIYIIGKDAVAYWIIEEKPVKVTPAYVRYTVHVSPYAHMYGDISVPGTVFEDGNEAVERYIRDNFGSIELSGPSLDFHGIDIDFEKEDD